MDRIIELLGSTQGIVIALSAAVSALAGLLLARNDGTLPPNGTRRRDARSFDASIAELRHLRVTLAPVRVRSRRRID